MSIILEPSGSSIICATYFPIPKALTAYSESATTMLSCPNNSWFLTRKLQRKDCWQNSRTFQHFCLLQMRDPDLTLQVSFWLCSLHKAVHWNTPFILGFIKINQKLPSVNRKRDGDADSIKHLGTYTSLEICSFSIFTDDKLTDQTSAKCVFHPSTELGL